MSTHSVEKHLQLSVEDYDRLIRTFVPYYDEFFKNAVNLIQALTPPTARLLDLGGGTGALTQALLQNCPQARVELLDIDPQMLEQAQRRLAAHHERVVIRQGSFYDPLPQSDAIVASLSLHHIHDLAKKTQVYASILQALKPGGVFLNLDAAVSAHPKLETLTYDRWANFMNDHGISKEDAHRHFADWAREDRYFSLHEELNALSKAGFQSPECFWRRGPIAIYGGMRH